MAAKKGFLVRGTLRPSLGVGGTVNPQKAVMTVPPTPRVRVPNRVPSSISLKRPGR